MGKEHMARVYEVLPQQLALDERHVLQVVAESTADDRIGFAHRRIDLAGRVGFHGAHPEKLLATRLSALEEAGFISQKREKNQYGMWTGRVYVELTIEEGTQTPRGKAEHEKSKRRAGVARDDAGRFIHQPQPTDNGHKPSPTDDGDDDHQPQPTAADTPVATEKPSAAATEKPSAAGDGGESPDIDPIATRQHQRRGSFEEEKKRQIEALLGEQDA